MIMSLVLFENEFLHIVSISFTALILNELIMVALEITTWSVRQPHAHALVTKVSTGPRHVYMIISEVATLFFYAISMAFLPEYFGKRAISAALNFMKRPLMTDAMFSLPHRPHVCRLRRLCVEDSRHCCYQHYTLIHYQAHSKEGRSSGLEQATVILSLFNLRDFYGLTPPCEAEVQRASNPSTILSLAWTRYVTSFHPCLTVIRRPCNYGSFDPSNVHPHRHKLFK